MTNNDRPADSSGSKLQRVLSAEAIEQYKAKLSDLGNVGTRQTAMTAYYVSIISILFGVLAFKEKEFSQIDTVILLMVCGAGFLVCLLWFCSLTFFRGLFRAKLRVLKEIEDSLPFQTFRKEFKLMHRSGVTSWIRIERFVPVIFGVFFLGIIFLRIAHLLPCCKS